MSDDNVIPLELHRPPHLSLDAVVGEFLSTAWHASLKAGASEREIAASMAQFAGVALAGDLDEMVARKEQRERHADDLGLMVIAGLRYFEALELLLDGKRDEALKYILAGADHLTAWAVKNAMTRSEPVDAGPSINGIAEAMRGRLVPVPAIRKALGEAFAQQLSRLD